MEETKEPCIYYTKNFFKYHWRGLVTLVVPIVCLPIMIGQYERHLRCLYVVCVMALLWVTESIPLYVTGMIPILGFPILGIMDTKKVTVEYFKEPIVIFAGSIMVALSIEYCNLHKRLALGLITIIGVGPKLLLGTIIFLSSFLSMWFQNTAVTASMCPIVKALLNELNTQGTIKIYKDKKPGSPEDEAPRPTKLATGYYLAIAYASTIGGCSTLIGTATNLTFKGIYESAFPAAGDDITFTKFMAYNLPWVIIDLILLFFTLCFTHLGMFRPDSEDGKNVAEFSKGKDVAIAAIKQKYDELGPMTIHEVQIFLLFLLMVSLLFFRSPGFMTGWADLVTGSVIGGSTPVILIVLLLFFLPMNYQFFKYCCGKGPFPTATTPALMSWRFIHDNFPWGLLFLVGGGIALATGSKDSGMSKWLADKMTVFKDFPEIALKLLAILVAAFFSGFSSNVAICNIIVPVLAEIAVAIKVHPLDLIYPAGMGCSVAFLFPVSTPPNSIVSTYANIPTKYFIYAGIIPTVLTILCIYLTALFWQEFVYPDTKGFPSWISRD